MGSFHLYLQRIITRLLHCVPIEPTNEKKAKIPSDHAERVIAGQEGGSGDGRDRLLAGVDEVRINLEETGSGFDELDQESLKGSSFKVRFIAKKLDRSDVLL